MKKILYSLMMILTLAACERNHPPVIQKILCSPEKRNAGALFTFTASASDEDGDLLSYSWQCDAGEFPDGATGFQTKWKSPLDGTGKTYTLTVSVTDGDEEASMDYPITLTEVLYGNLEGSAFFKGTAIMVPGVTVTVGDRSIITDSTGLFQLQHLPIGTYTLVAEREDFGIVNQSVKINENSWTTARLAMVSVKLTGKIYGYVKDQDSLPVSGAVVVMLNPDGQESGLTVTTGSTGFYQIQGVPLGNRYIRARKATNEEYRFDTYEARIAINEPQQVLDISMHKLALNGTMLDRRSNRIYRTRIIGSQTWMAENLDYLPQVFPPSAGSEKAARYYVYNYDGADTASAKTTSHYRNYGVLYNYEAAIRACPPGWHLPDGTDFWFLTDFLGENPGLKLKSVSGWLEGGNGNNSSGFGAVPAGARSGNGFYGLGENTVYWSSAYSNGYYLVRILYGSQNNFWSTRGTLSNGYSVRCVRD